MKVEGRPMVREVRMKVRYVVLYVDDADICRTFWVEQVGMVEKGRTEVDGFAIVQVGFADQPFAFELVPLALMKDNPDQLDLATPSIALRMAARLSFPPTLNAVGVSQASIVSPSRLAQRKFRSLRAFQNSQWHIRV